MMDRLDSNLTHLANDGIASAGTNTKSIRELIKLPVKKLPDRYVGDSDLCSCLVPEICQTQNECTKLGLDGERAAVISFLASKGVGSVEDLRDRDVIDLGKRCRAFQRQEIEAHLKVNKTRADSEKTGLKAESKAESEVELTKRNCVFSVFCFR